jgi:hypothetical protein
MSSICINKSKYTRHPNIWYPSTHSNFTKYFPITSYKHLLPAAKHQLPHLPCHCSFHISLVAAAHCWKSAKTVKNFNANYRKGKLRIEVLPRMIIEIQVRIQVDTTSAPGLSLKLMIQVAFTNSIYENDR